MGDKATFDWSMTDEQLLDGLVAAGSRARYAFVIGCARPTLDYHIDQRGIREEAQRRVAVARAAQMTEHTIADAPTAATERIGENEAAFYGLASEDLADADALLRRRGFDPKVWLVSGASITEWGRDPVTGAPYQRLKVTLKRRVSILSLLPATHDSVPVVRPLAPRRSAGATTWLVVSDHHAPYHDPMLHECILQFIRDVRPDHGVFAGDTLDLPHPSKHRRNPKFNATPQQCVDAGYPMLRDYVEADRRTRWVKLLGNHDVRIRNFLLESSAHELATLHPADTGQGDVDALTPALAVSRLLHLEALGIECREPGGEYGDEMAAICRDLGVIHGESTGKDPMAAELARYGHSLLGGHTHHKTSVFSTTWDWDGPSTRVGLGLGCMCLIEGGLGYARKPNWQNGCGFVTAYPDGRFNVEHVNWDGESLLWRDQRWSA